ncbi:MAG TPA: hypothetical protein VHO69_13910 [Phototrophicaceae bacterium]|nr:hypothetical protein [Phototrophicaceae bacterium]
MSKRFGLTIILMVGSLLTIRSVALAQHTITVICNSSEPQTKPFSLPGTYFHLIGQPLFSDPNSNYQIEAISASGSQQYTVPFPRETSLELYPPTVSPDGRYVVFRPASEKVGLTVWDLQTNAFASLPLQRSDLDYLIYTHDTSYQRKYHLLSWFDDSYLLLQYYDDPSNRFDYHVNGQKRFAITEAPLKITEQTTEVITYPDLAIPEGNKYPAIQFSPDHR